MLELYGWPVVTAENCFEIIRKCGIVPWNPVQEPQPLDQYLALASPAQQEEYKRFGPKNFLVRFENPATREPFNGFRSVFKPYALVFALLDDHVPVTAEWKHGNARVTIVPVCGVPGKTEAALPTLAAQMEATARREWAEETGTELESIVPLGSPDGIFSEARKADMRYFPFLGIVKTSVVKGPTKFDDRETLQMVLFPLAEWVKLIETSELWSNNQDFGLEACTRDGTYAALRAMGRLKFS